MVFRWVSIRGFRKRSNVGGSFFFPAYPDLSEGSSRFGETSCHCFSASLQINVWLVSVPIWNKLWGKTTSIGLSVENASGKISSRFPLFRLVPSYIRPRWVSNVTLHALANLFNNVCLKIAILTWFHRTELPNKSEIFTRITKYQLNLAGCDIYVCIRHVTDYFSTCTVNGMDRWPQGKTRYVPAS